ncbi:MAG: hypothetical protein IM574_07710 [Cytophagales bacterium]|nr:hypothetical protein [Cytophagales bacterium]MCA6386366.1 hypothetical protein [Cytophagales bacterium]MCA6390463.1 hypothetical protein [Cytophagales bacterium]MCA6395041.1 hypothetical protein [Cytophagales bacterium]MCA6397951.1 hypothetical protein [Cytophagales bacterium]
MPVYKPANMTADIAITAKNHRNGKKKSSSYDKPSATFEQTNTNPNGIF